MKSKADMSPAAITDRLRLMNELWLLSVKLGESKALGKVRTSQETKVDRPSKDKR